MAFLILDPHLFIYPHGEHEPLERKKVAQFVLKVNEWVKHLDGSELGIGISEDIIRLLKTHPRSILNKQFLNEVSRILRKAVSTINNLLVPLFSTLWDKLTFSAAIRTIDPKQLCFTTKNAFIAPVEFVTRLPEGLREPFLRLLGDITFARAQKFFPIAAFDQVQFITTTNDEVDWLLDEPRLLTHAHIEYRWLTPDAENGLVAEEFSDEYDILCDVSLLEETQPFKPLRTLRDIIDTTLNHCGSAVVMSRELEGQLKRRKESFPDAEKLERAINALGTIWLPEYRLRRREQHTHNNAIQYATEKFRKAISHNISNESESVRNNPRLRNQRLVKYAEMELYAFLHVKISPRIYFDVVNYGGQDIIVLGPIGHLDTARHGANSTA